MILSSVTAVCAALLILSHPVPDLPAGPVCTPSPPAVSTDSVLYDRWTDMADEIDNALLSHVSDTAIVTVTEVESRDYYYLLTHVLISDPSQIHAGLSEDDYGGERERPTEAAQRLGWIVGINASNFDWSSNRPTYANVKIKDSCVMPDSRTKANGMEVCLTDSGNLFSPEPGMTTDQLLAMNVTDTWCCGDTLLIRNGEKVNEGIESYQYRYPRTAIGMVAPCEYYIITAGNGDGYKKGMTYTEIRNVLFEHGCGFGKCMDGGGSASLVVDGALINRPAGGKERAVTDFLYFTD